MSKTEAKKVTPTANGKGPATELPDTGNIDKIRDILFGAHSREMEKRMARLEERLTKEAAAIQEDVRKQLASLETYVKKEVDALSDRLKNEQAERSAGIRDLVNDLKESSKTVDKKVAQLDELVAKSQRELRQQILDQSKTLSDAIKQKSELIMSTVEGHVQELRTEKTDRTSLADLFTEISVRLKNNFKLPARD